MEAAAVNFVERLLLLESDNFRDSHPKWKACAV